MGTPTDPEVRRAIVCDPAFHDVDTLLDRVTPGVVPWQELNGIGALIQSTVRASPALERYVLDLWEATATPRKAEVQLDGVDIDRLVLAGASPRGMMALMRAARVVAWLAGRDHLRPEDIAGVAPAVLAHRIFFTPLYELRRTELADLLVAQILERVPTPR